MDGNSLISLEGLTKPATVLIEKISDAVGGLYKPIQMRRVAEAQADAALIHAEAEIEITALHRRGLLRWIEEIAEEQFNMEEVTRKALPLVTEDASPSDMDTDWIKNFFAKCRGISDDAMQDLWARILAGEANMPSSFSRQTINLLESLGPREAELFTSVCRFTWDMKGHGTNVVRCPVIFTSDAVQQIYTENGITFSSLDRLADLGLIHSGEHAYQVHYRLGHRPGNRASQAIASYFGRPLSLQIKDFITVPTLFIGSVAFTYCGAELSLVSKPAAVAEFYEYVQDRWDSEGYIGQISTSSHPEGKLYLEALEIRASPGMVLG